jgi:hypothetical protein
VLQLPCSVLFDNSVDILPLRGIPLMYDGAGQVVDRAGAADAVADVRTEERT